MSDHNRSCSDVLDQLPLFVGGDIEDQAALEVAAHLERCPACRAVEARAAEARAELLSVVEGEVRGGGPNLWPGVRVGLQQAGLVADPAPPRALRRVLGAAGVAVLAVAALLMVLALWPLLRGGATGSQPGDGILDRNLTEADPVAPALFAEHQPEAAASEGGLVPITDPEDLLRSRLQPGWQDPDHLRLSSSPIVR